ncbi:hypothetical protein ABXN37_16585 [Piscinibacter sakaiensis]|uniref:hypothetical protein n=1 Tax=Piscinibacter sakaiensis TaxID=1547922 RepID=UPI0012FC61FF|nr:hypothetical protein [Piscinibacter sakaiensis]
MKKLDVGFRGWGHDHVLGVLADIDGQVHFAYSSGSPGLRRRTRHGCARFQAER